MDRCGTGLLITFEGPDGAGKTTQISRLAEWLRAQGIEPVLLRQPGGTPLGERIRATLLDSRTDQTLGHVSPLAELALMFADRAQSIAQVIRPSLESGRVVLCDRYTDSSEAYQGAGRRLGTERVLHLHRLLCEDLLPDLTIMLLPDVEKAQLRARQRNERQQSRGKRGDENRFEAEGEDFFRRVHAAYAEIAEREPGRVRVFTDGTIDDIASRIQVVVAERLSQARS